MRSENTAMFITDHLKAFNRYRSDANGLNYVLIDMADDLVRDGPLLQPCYMMNKMYDANVVVDFITIADVLQKDSS